MIYVYHHKVLCLVSCSDGNIYNQNESEEDAKTLEYSKVFGRTSVIGVYMYVPENT